MAGAPEGNRNAAKGKLWSAAIIRALDRRQTGLEKVKALDEIADKLIQKCYDGDFTAIQELGNRLDGKPAQAIIGGDEDDPPLRIQKVERVIVHPENTDS